MHSINAHRRMFYLLQRKLFFFVYSYIIFYAKFILILFAFFYCKKKYYISVTRESACITNHA